MDFFEMSGRNWELLAWCLVGTIMVITYFRHCSNKAASPPALPLQLGAAVVAKVDVVKSLEGINTLLIELPNGVVTLEDVPEYAGVILTLGIGTAVVAVACAAAYVYPGLTNNGAGLE